MKNSYLDVCELLLKQGESQPDAIAVFDEKNPTNVISKFSKKLAKIHVFIAEFEITIELCVFFNKKCVF